MICGELGLRGAGWVAEVVGQLTAERALDQCLLEPPRCGLDFLGRQRAVANNLIKDFCRDRRQYLGGRLLQFRFAGHTDSSCYAPHTKFLTGPSPFETFGSTVRTPIMALTSSAVTIEACTLMASCH
jgi:hypothetical protein